MLDTANVVLADQEPETHDFRATIDHVLGQCPAKAVRRARD